MEQQTKRSKEVDMVNENTPLDFGKHRGSSIKEICEDNPEYISYLSMRRIDSNGSIEYRCEEALEEISINIGEMLDFYKNDRTILNKLENITHPGWKIAFENAHDTMEKLGMLYSVRDDIVSLCGTDGQNKLSDRLSSLLFLSTKAKFVYAARNYIDSHRLCWKCFNVLVPIGNSRENGKSSHGDWSTRKLHKKCWKEMKKDNED